VRAFDALLDERIDERLRRYLSIEEAGRFVATSRTS